MEGDNQKQADFLSRSLAKVDPKKIHDLHLIISSISRPEHLTLFELGIAKKVDFAFAGPQSLRVAQLLEDGVLEIGAIHTYVELYARLLVDLIPNVVLVCAEQADQEGNLFTGPNTEDTPVIVEAAAFHDAIVIVQVNKIVDTLPRVDIPGSWVDIVVEADKPYAVEPLFTRDPRHIGDLQILTGMMDLMSLIGHPWHLVSSYTIMTREARLGLNGPEVIEQESGIDEFDASDRALIWAIHGGEQRVGMGLADLLVEDDADKIAAAVRDCVHKGVPEKHRTEQVELYRARIAALDTSSQIDPATLRQQWANPEGGVR